MCIVSLIVASVLLAFVILMLGVSVSFLVGLFYGAPFVPSDRKRVATMVEYSGASVGKRVADIGSGDGRILIALARAGAEAHGYEINPFLTFYSRWRIRAAGLSDSAFVHRTDFKRADLSGFDAVTVYGIDYMMKALAKKCANELPSHGVIVSNGFTVPKWQEECSDGKVRRYIRNQ